MHALVSQATRAGRQFAQKMSGIELHISAKSVDISNAPVAAEKIGARLAHEQIPIESARQAVDLGMKRLLLPDGPRRRFATESATALSAASG